MYDDLGKIFVILLAVIDPVSTLALFLGVTAHHAHEERFKIALRSILYSAGVLVGFVIVGQIFLTHMGVKMEAFQIAGGVILFVFGMKMIFDNGEEFRPVAPEKGHDVAIFPLAIPSIASPGAIMAVVVLTDNDRFSYGEQAVTTLLMLAVLGITFAGMLFAGRVLKIIGHGGVNIMTRVMGLVLASLATEMVIEGIQIVMKNKPA